MGDDVPDRVESGDAPAPPPAETGERCPECGGSGERDGRECPACEGTGHVMRGLGGG